MQAVDYIKRLPNKSAVPFATLYPNASPSAVDLLSKMLVFDPRKRISAANVSPQPGVSLVQSKAEQYHMRSDKASHFGWAEDNFLLAILSPSTTPAHLP